MDDVVYDRTKEQRDYWKERAERLLESANRLQAIIDRIDRRLGQGWTAKLADALTPASGGAVDG